MVLGIDKFKMKAPAGSGSSEVSFLIDDALWVFHVAEEAEGKRVLPSTGPLNEGRSLGTLPLSKPKATPPHAAALGIESQHESWKGRHDANCSAE